MIEYLPTTQERPPPPPPQPRQEETLHPMGEQQQQPPQSPAPSAPELQQRPTKPSQSPNRRPVRRRRRLRKPRSQPPPQAMEQATGDQPQNAPQSPGQIQQPAETQTQTHLSQSPGPPTQTPPNPSTEPTPDQAPVEREATPDGTPADDEPQQTPVENEEPEAAPGADGMDKPQEGPVEGEDLGAIDNLEGDNEQPNQGAAMDNLEGDNEQPNQGPGEAGDNVDDEDPNQAAQPGPPMEDAYDPNLAHRVYDEPYNDINNAPINQNRRDSAPVDYEVKTRTIQPMYRDARDASMDRRRAEYASRAPSFFFRTHVDGPFTTERARSFRSRDAQPGVAARRTMIRPAPAAGYIFLYFLTRKSNLAGIQCYFYHNHGSHYSPQPKSETSSITCSRRVFLQTTEFI